MHEGSRFRLYAKLRIYWPMLLDGKSSRKGQWHDSGNLDQSRSESNPMHVKGLIWLGLRTFQRRVMVLRVVLLQDVLHVVRDLVDLEREEQRLGLEIPRLQDEQHPTCQAVVAIGPPATFCGQDQIDHTLLHLQHGTTL